MRLQSFFAYFILFSKINQRKLYTVVFKLKAVNNSRNHATSATAIQFNVSDKPIRGWKNEKSKIKRVIGYQKSM